MILLNAVIIIIADSAIFTFITLLLSDVTTSTTMILLVTFLMFVAGLKLVNEVKQSKYYYDIDIDMKSNKIIEVSIMEENPFFPGEEKRKIYQSILYMIPSGDTMLMANKFTQTIDIENRLGYSNSIILLALAGETVLFTVAGMVIFNKKQLK